MGRDDAVSGSKRGRLRGEKRSASPRGLFTKQAIEARWQRSDVTAVFAEVGTGIEHCTDYDPKTFKDRLIGVYRGGKR